VDCKEFREVLDLYVDEELSPDAMTAARLHLAECASCRAAERELLRLKRALKIVVSKHQPPPELLGAVRDIYQPWWRKLLRGAGASGEATSARPFWRRKVVLPAPVFASLLLAFVAFGLWLARLQTSRPPQPAARSAPTKPPAPQQTDAAFDFGRFDQGGRASLYKERR
jgi:hypothetical protein